MFEHSIMTFGESVSTFFLYDLALLGIIQKLATESESSFVPVHNFYLKKKVCSIEKKRIKNLKVK